MKLSNLRRETVENTARLSATVRWEDSDKPEMQVFFGTDSDHGDGLVENYNAFLAGCAVPAMFHGEKRLYLDGAACPELKDNIVDALGWLRYWFYPQCAIPGIEAKSIDNRTADGKDRTGFFLSGGIDSLAALRYNMLTYPRGHAGAFRYGLMIHGQNIESDTRLSTFEHAFKELTPVAQEAEMELIPVYTNIRDLEPLPNLFVRTNGTILAAVGHAFSGLFNTITISATENIPALMFTKKGFVKPLGSHPLVDNACGSRGLRIRQDGLSLSRLDKARIVADWDTGLQSVKVCGPNWPGENCGECEKCIRTMLAFVALGVLQKTRAFAADDISAQMVRKCVVKPPLAKGSFSNEYFYLELIPLLRQRGRQDLIAEIDKIVAIGRAKYHKRAFKDSIKEMDQEHFGNLLLKMKRLIYHPHKK